MQNSFEISTQYLEWLKSFQRCVRELDYDGAEELHASNCIFSGTLTESSARTKHYRIAQWETVWPISREFEFLSVTGFRPMGSDCAMQLKWSNSSMIAGDWKNRKGIASFVLKGLERPLAVMSHFSLTDDSRLSEGRW